MFSLDFLRAAAPGYDIRYTDSVGSTNAALLGDASARAGSVLIAGSQSAGRGRMARAFASPEGGLYMSVLLAPASVDEALAITPRAAVAVSRAIESVSGRETAIKWVNDILIDGKKVCGILAEARAGEGLAVVLGIGVNVSAVPAGLEGTAGAVFDEAPALARERLAAAILGELRERRDVYAEYVRRCSTPGNMVDVARGGERFIARALGIDERFRLLVERADGSRAALDSGEVTLHR